jgi:hypothetical protein
MFIEKETKHLLMTFCIRRCAKAVSRRFVSYELLSFVIVYIMTLHPWKRTLHGWTAWWKKCVSVDLMHLFLVFCDSKINIYIHWLSRLWIYHYVEYVDCNIWLLVLVSLANPHPFNAHIWKSPSPKGLFVDKYENDIHAHVYNQYDTYVAEFHKKRKMYTLSVADKWCWEVNLSLN